MKRRVLRRKKMIELINSGSTMLNLACSDRVEGAFKPGTIVTIPGGTDSGKTMLVLTTLACCANDPRFDQYDLIYDDVEAKMSIDISSMFNPITAERIQGPPYGRSASIQDFEANAVKALRESETPCIYVLDTPDCLTSTEELEKIHQRLLKLAKSPDDVKNLSGSYHMEKAKMMHQVLREVNDAIGKTKSLLIMLQQSKQKIGAMFGRKTTTSGGNAPAHYSIHRIWMSQQKQIKKKDEVVGRTVIAQIEKNHYNGKFGREAKFDIYYDYGIDDTGSIIDWLVSSGYWKKRGAVIDAIDLNEKTTRSRLIKIIEDNGNEQELKNIVQTYWIQKEDELKLNRKKRFR